MEGVRKLHEAKMEHDKNTHNSRLERAHIIRVPEGRPRACWKIALT